MDSAREREAGKDPGTSGQKAKGPHGELDYIELPKPVVPRTQNRDLLKNQKAIVTGASSGIGRAIAYSLAQAGAAVCINYVSRADDAEKMVEEMRGHGHTAISFKADVSNEDDVKKMFDAARGEFGEIGRAHV